MKKATKNKVGELSKRASFVAPAPDPLIEHSRIQYLVRTIFSCLALGHIAYRGKAVELVYTECKTSEALDTAERAARMSNNINAGAGFMLPCTFEDKEAAITALADGSFYPATNEHGLWVLWRSDGKWIFEDPWRAIQRAKVALQCACAWEGLPLPDDAGVCLELLRKYKTIAGQGDMDPV